MMVVLEMVAGRSVFAMVVNVIFAPSPFRNEPDVTAPASALIAA
jgi:hypothetical protein